MPRPFQVRCASLCVSVGLVVEVVSAASGELVARLSTQLFRGVLYEVGEKKMQGSHEGT